MFAKYNIQKQQSNPFNDDEYMHCNVGQWSSASSQCTRVAGMRAREVV